MVTTRRNNLKKTKADNNVGELGQRITERHWFRDGIASDTVQQAKPVNPHKADCGITSISRKCWIIPTNNSYREARRTSFGSKAPQVFVQ
jgi:hypothetical protein